MQLINKIFTACYYFRVYHLFLVLYNERTSAVLKLFIWRRNDDAHINADTGPFHNLITKVSIL